MNVNHLVVTLVLAGGGAAIGSYIVPSSGELAMMFLKSGRLGDAQAALEREIETGALDPTNVHYAMQTYLRLGEIDKAAAIVERYLDDRIEHFERLRLERGRPDPAATEQVVATRRLLASLYKDLGKTALYQRNLEEIEVLAPAPAQRRELARTYLVLGQYPQWLATVERLIADGTATPKEYAALAQVHARAGDFDRGLDVLRRFRSHLPNEVTIDIYYLAVAIELDAKRPPRAYALAVEAHARWPTQATALSLAYALFSRGQGALALQLLAKYSAESARDPELLRFLVTVEVSLGRHGPALQRLKDAEQAGTLGDGEIALFLVTAIQAGDWDAAKRMFRKADAARLSREALLAFAEEAVSRRDREAVLGLTERLPNDVLAAMPVVAAQLALTVEDRAGALRWAEAAERLKDVSVHDSIALAALYARLDQAAKAGAILRALGERRELPDYLLPQLALHFVKLGLARDGLALVADLRRAQPGVWAELAHALLARRLNAPADMAWLAGLDAKAAPPQFAAAGYFAAMELRDYEIAVAFGRHLVAQNETAENRVRLARALAFHGRVDEAAALVADLPDQQAGIADIQSIALLQALKSGKIQPPELTRRIVARLRENGQTQAQKKQFIDDLIASKAFAILLPALEAAYRELGDEALAYYFDALQSAGDKRALQAALRREVARLDPGPVLARIARIALEEGAFDGARLAYAKILRAEPRNREALRGMGLLAAWSDDPSGARRHLEAFVAQGGDDYLVDFTLGEVVTVSADWQAATPHYRRALDKILRLKQAGPDERKIQAQILYRLGRVDEANALYAALLRQFPRDRELREKYSEFLSDIGRYQESDRVRGQR